jgi:hypothetical protein
MSRPKWNKPSAQAVTDVAPPTPTQAGPAPIKKGARYGRWRLLRDSGVLRSGHRYAPCECVCGTQALVFEAHLVKGESTGCRSVKCRQANA